LSKTFGDGSPQNVHNQAKIGQSAEAKSAASSLVCLLIKIAQIIDEF
jgi:hypothetical protein